MKKILIILCCLLVLAGCSLGINDNKPEKAVNTFFEKYRNKDKNVLEQLNNAIESEILNEKDKVRYKKLMEKQYDSLAYVIKDVKQDKNSATVDVEITVLDYRSAILKAEEYLKNNQDKFKDDKGNFSEEKYFSYKIDKMEEVDTTVNHTLELSLTKENNMWKVNELSSENISKLHGLY